MFKRFYLIIGIAALLYLAVFPAISSFGAEEPSSPKEDYILSPYDEIEIKVAGEDDLTGVYKIDDEGSIIFPILGRINVKDMTVAQAEERIAKPLEKDYFKSKATVYIQVKKFHKRKVIISGEVRNPGPYEIEEDKGISLIDLITLAGGPTDKACLNSTTVIRPEGKAKGSTFKARAGDILNAKEKDIILKPGDRVNIPRASVIVMGEVSTPGKYDFGDANKMTLLGAVSMAGGFTRIADINGVRIIRINELGEKKNIRIRVSDIYKGKDKDATLEPDDIIVVPESWF